MDDNKMQQFISITGASVEEATSLLEACNGDVNLAVTMHLDNNGGSSSSGLTRDLLSPSTTTQTYEERHGIRAPIPQKQDVLIEQEQTRRTFRRRNLPKSVFDPFQDYSNNKPGASSIGPMDDHRNTLAELFRPPIDLMFRGDFAEARIAGQSRGKWLMVNLQDSTDFSCQVLNRDLWSNPVVKKLISDHFVFWQIQKITDDGIRFGQLYHIDTYPAIVIIDPRTGEKIEQWCYAISVKDFISKVNEFNIINKLDEDQSQTRSQQFSVYDTSEDAQLEAAIKASLAQTSNHIVISNSDSESEGDCVVAITSGDEDTASSPASSNNSSPIISNSINNKEMAGVVIRDPLSNSTGMGLRSMRSRKRPADMVWGSGEDEQPGQSNRTRRSKTRRLEKRTKNTAQKSELSDDFEDVHIKDEANVDDVEESNAVGKVDRTSEIASGCVDSVAMRDGSHMMTDGDDVCQILIRFPDGRRMIKSFTAKAPIKELFECLKQEGFSLSEYEITLTFPHTVLSSLPPFTTFRSAGLCPRQTVYLQRAD